MNLNTFRGLVFYRSQCTTMTFFFRTSLVYNVNVTHQGLTLFKHIAITILFCVVIKQFSSARILRRQSKNIKLWKNKV